MPKDLLMELLGVHWIVGRLDSLFDAFSVSFGLMVFRSSSFVVSLGCDSAHFTHLRFLNFFRCLNFKVHYYLFIGVSRFCRVIMGLKSTRGTKGEIKFGFLFYLFIFYLDCKSGLASSQTWIVCSCSLCLDGVVRLGVTLYEEWLSCTDLHNFFFLSLYFFYPDGFQLNPHLIELLQVNLRLK